MKKNVSETSIEAYHSLSLGPRQQQIYWALHQGPMTNRELKEFFKERHLEIDLCSITGRVKELRELGLVELKTIKVSSETEKKNKVWGIIENRQQLEMFG